MIAPTRKSLLVALNQEKLFPNRQRLLKQLWRLEQNEQPADDALYEQATDRPDIPTRK